MVVGAKFSHACFSSRLAGAYARKCGKTSPALWNGRGHDLRPVKQVQHSGGCEQWRWANGRESRKIRRGRAIDAPTLVQGIGAAAHEC